MRFASVESSDEAVVPLTELSFHTQIVRIKHEKEQDWHKGNPDIARLGLVRHDNDDRLQQPYAPCVCASAV